MFPLKIKSVYFFVYACIKHRVLPHKYFGLNYSHYKSGYSSKYELDRFIPEKNRLSLMLISPNDDMFKVIGKIKKDFKFPIMLKPEYGYLSYGVKKVENYDELIDSLTLIKKYGVRYICQEYCEYMLEFDIFYVHGKNGIEILSLTKSHLPSIIGDGVHTIKELILMSNVNDKTLLLKRNTKHKDRILAHNERYVLSKANSILLGSTYSDEYTLLNTQKKKIEQVIGELNTFKVNRISLKTQSFDDLVNGNFKIFEMNILFPGAINALDPLHTNKKQNQIVKNTMNNIIKTIKDNNPIISLKAVFDFYVKYIYYSYKIKRLKNVF